MITQIELKRQITYCSETGIFKWIGKKLGAKREIAGHLRKDGYVTIRINYENYLAHRLAWLYMAGEFPEGFIDHIDGNPSNNSFVNLRKADHAQNERNRTFSKNNRLKIKGVYPTEYGTYRACVVKDKKQYAKSFKDIADAERWASEMREILHLEYARH